MRRFTVDVSRIIGAFLAITSAPPEGLERFQQAGLYSGATVNVLIES
jgi:hypothetical protein